MGPGALASASPGSRQPVRPGASGTDHPGRSRPAGTARNGLPTKTDARRRAGRPSITTKLERSQKLKSNAQNHTTIRVRSLDPPSGIMAPPMDAQRYRFRRGRPRKKSAFDSGSESLPSFIKALVFMCLLWVFPAFRCRVRLRMAVARCGRSAPLRNARNGPGSMPRSGLPFAGQRVPDRLGQIIYAFDRMVPEHAIQGNG